MNSLGSTFPFKDPAPKVDSVQIIQGGKGLSIDFNVLDNVTGRRGRASFTFHFSSSWLHSSSPLLCGHEYYRKQPDYFSKVCSFSRAVSASIVQNGVSIRFESASEDGKLHAFQDTYPACFLFAYAPFTGVLKSHSPEEVAAFLGELDPSKSMKSLCHRADVSLINYYAQQKQKPWSRFPKGHPENTMNHEHLSSIPTYDAEAVRKDPEQQRLMLLDICAHPGLVAVYNVNPPQAYDEDTVAEALFDWFFDVFGKANQHHSRKNQVFQVCQLFEMPEHVVSVDYDVNIPLNMHTDGVNYMASGSYIQANYQAVGDVTTRIVDGFACSDYLKNRYPDYYDILTSTPVTYGMRHQLYDRNGIHSDIKKRQNELRARSDEDDFREVELISTREGIRLEKGVREVRDEDGKLRHEEKEIPVQINYCPTKIGVNAMSPDDFDKFMEANAKWYDIVEGREAGIKSAYFPAIDWPQDTMLIFNNQRMLHGRATVINAGLQDHIYRPVNIINPGDGNVTVLEHGNEQDENGNDTGESYLQKIKNGKVKPIDKPKAKDIRRQLIGAYLNRGFGESRLRLLTMKMLEGEFAKTLTMEVHSEFGNTKKDGDMQSGNDVLACWFPRCPSKVLERMIPASDLVDDGF